MIFAKLNRGLRRQSKECRTFEFRVLAEDHRDLQLSADIHKKNQPSSSTRVVLFGNTYRLLDT